MTTEMAPPVGERARVALVCCQDYDEAAVLSATARAFDLLGGAGRFVRAGERIVLKPNLLAASTPEGQVCPHPTVFRAVATQFAGVEAQLSWGDSPGFGRAAGVARKCGIAAVSDELGIPEADFSAGRTVSFPEGRLIKQFTVAASVLNADGIVSVSKLKTHGLTRMTGAVKNTFGCIPGLLKSEFHVRMGDTERLAQAIVDLNRLLRPRLYVMDAIVAMQGNGPRGGDPRPLHALLLSDDPVALDSIACRIINLDRRLVPTITWGEEFELGTASDVEVLGDPVDSFIDRGFVVNRKPQSTTGQTNAVTGPLGRFFKNRLVPRPVIDPDLCTACGTCVAVCPVTPKAVEFESPAARAQKRPPAHHYGRCIRCYCCQELCPERAITIRQPLLGRVIH
jgi:uncharacterized protein (DUF362 family)/ferredoxin